MFFYGEAPAVAKVFVESVSYLGPGMPTLPLEEQGEQDLRATMTFYRLALRMALHQGVPEAVTDIIIGWHDESFEALVRASESFRKRVFDGQYRHPLAKTEKNRSKYLKIAESVASES